MYLWEHCNAWLTCDINTQRVFPSFQSSLHMDWPKQVYITIIHVNEYYRHLEWIPDSLYLAFLWIKYYFIGVTSVWPFEWRLSMKILIHLSLFSRHLFYLFTANVYLHEISTKFFSTFFLFSLTCFTQGRSRHSHRMKNAPHSHISTLQYILFSYVLTFHLVSDAPIDTSVQYHTLYHITSSTSHLFSFFVFVFLLFSLSLCLCYTRNVNAQFEQRKNNNICLIVEFIDENFVFFFIALRNKTMAALKKWRFYTERKEKNPKYFHSNQFIPCFLFIFMLILLKLQYWLMLSIASQCNEFDSYLYLFFSHNAFCSGKWNVNFPVLMILITNQSNGSRFH